MADGPQDDLEHRVLVAAPTRRDGELARDVLGAGGVAAVCCAGLAPLADALPAGAGAVLLADTVLDDAPGLERLLSALGAQAEWSEVPVLVLARAGPPSPALARFVAGTAGVTILERPVQMRTLLSSVQGALRARDRQYQVRSHLDSIRRASEALRQAKAEADRANEAKDRFLAVLSHELRTPLAPVLMVTSVLARDPTTPPHVAEHLEMIRRNVELETKLIDDLLDLSRIANGKLPLDFLPVRVNELVRQVLEMVASDFNKKSVSLRLEMGDQSDHVTGDAARLQQALWNLLKNAAKFTPTKGSVTIRTGAGSAGTFRVEVEDTGVGIPATVLPHLFNAFEQGGDAVTKQFGGLGLGLAISKAVIDFHGGTLVAASEGPGRGARFTIELPLAARVATDDAAAVPSAGPTRGPGGLRLLVVEDHEDTAAMLARVLELSGHTVKTAATAEAAVALAETEAFDAVLSDVGLPDRTGFELMRELKERFRLPGVCMSGYGMEDDRRQSRDAGFVEHLVKPVSPEQLERAIERLVARQSAR